MTKRHIKPDNKTAKRHILDVLRSMESVVSPSEMSDMTGISHNTVKGTMNALAKSGEIKKRSRGQYYAPSESQATEEQDVMYGGGDGSSTPECSSHNDTGRKLRAVPVWGGDAPSHTDHMMHLDADLLTSTGISFDGTTIIPIQGSQAEPYLSHGQLALATPVDRIQGEDLYVYYSWAQEAHLVAWMDRCADTITLQTASRQNTYQPTGTQDIWERDDGRKEKLRVVGRVVGAVLPVGRQRAQKQELVRMLMQQ